MSRALSLKGSFGHFRRLSGFRATSAPHSVRVAAMRVLRTQNYSITLSARANSASGTVTPIALAVLRLITSSNLVGCWTGIDLAAAEEFDDLMRPYL
jgi:hypothetical protein